MTIVDPKTERPDQADLDKSAGRPEDADQWTAKIRNTAVEALPPQKLLPDRQPAYVASWIYVFGVTTVAALIVVIGTGIVLAIFGPNWWHVSSTGLFVNSLHMWSVEIFMFAMVIHLWGKFFMAAWRGKRTATWITGVVSFLVSVGAAFTGYLSQQNFDSQWILPLCIVALVGLHVLLVRLRGVVTPFPAKGETSDGQAAAVATTGAEVQA
jgi:quinol-cytochrome oxidoreductase complex cytochrome b subunit